MTRETIDFGIDLGTTNSVLSMWSKSGRVEVLKNIEQSQITPSAVWEDEKSQLRIGQVAKNATALRNESGNVKVEFKQDMGRKTPLKFSRSGRAMNPEELSAELLKELRSTARMRTGEDMEAAVITIPAAFPKAAIYATNKAAELAGFVSSPLCLEPVAAALAFNEQHSAEDGFWLVFDFGGGTFDAAIVRSRNEEFEIVTHAGDDQLGGKLIDWAVIDNILIPYVQREFDLPDFSRHSEDPKIKTAIARLKLATEEAKIRLSLAETADVEVDKFLETDAGTLPFEFELRRADVSRMAEPFFHRAINKCRQALRDERLDAGDIGKLVLVGGPTQMPVLREMLADGNIGLGIEVDYSVDPMTAVAEGAGVFARTQRMPRKPADSMATPDGGALHLSLEYEPAGPEEEVDVLGRLTLPDGSAAANWTIEFVRGNGDWSSGKVKLDVDGKFWTELLADDGENSYTIEVCDESGAARQCGPERISYLRKATFREIPLLETIAIAKADNTPEVVFQKGLALPLKKTLVRKQVERVVKGDPDTMIRIPFVEGSNSPADRNILMHAMMIAGDHPKVTRDIPPNSDVEVTVTIDESNRINIVAYVPFLDEDFEDIFDPARPDVDAQSLERETKQEIERFRTLEDRVAESGSPRAREMLAEFSAGRLVEEVEAGLAALGRADEAPDLLLNRLRDLRVGNDQIEAILQWPQLVQKAGEEKEWAEKIVNASAYATPEDQLELKRIDDLHDQAVTSEDVDLIRRVSDDYNDLYWKVAVKDPAYWARRFQHLREHRASMSDQALANDLFAQGHRSIDNNDVDGLKSAVRQLNQLLPRDVEPEPRGYQGTLL